MTETENKTDGNAPFFQPVRDKQAEIESAVREFSEAFVDAHAETNPHVTNWGQVYYNVDVEDAGKWTLNYDYEDRSLNYVRYEINTSPPDHLDGRERMDWEPPEVYLVSDYPTRRTDHFTQAIQTLDEFVESSQQDVMDANGTLVDNRNLPVLATQFENTLDMAQQETALEELLLGIEYHDLQAVMTVLADDDEDSKDVFMMLKYKDEYREDGETKTALKDTDLSIECMDEEIAFVRVHRYYDDYDGDPEKYYDLGYVVGMDDTDARFFIHRLRGTKKLKNKNVTWSVEDVKEAMGFDETYQDDSFNNIEYGVAYRLQGDLKAVRSDYEKERAEFEASIRRAERWEYEEEHVPEFAEERGLREDSDVTFTSGYRRNGHSPKVDFESNPPVDEDTTITDMLKEIQEKLGIEEETVRDLQDERDWSRLTSGRREEILADILRDEFYEWCDENEHVPLDEVEQSVQETVASQFEDARQQNEVFGNHLVVFSDALQHPDSQRRQSIIVPDESSVFIIHDEHQQKHLRLPAGVYRLDFLDRHDPEQFWFLN